MESSKLAFLAITLLIVSCYKAEGQIISTPCSSSAATSFTPCINFITGSSANGGSPTAACCDAVKSMMTDSVECACLIVTGNVPVSIPFISRPLVISLPRLCKTGVPLKCQASGVPLPAPGPVIFGPTPPPAAHSPATAAHSPATATHSPAPVAHSPATAAHSPATATHSPAPVAHSPATAAHSPIGQTDSKAVTTATAVPAPSPIGESPGDEVASSAASPSDDTAPAASPPRHGPFALGPVANPGIRPVIVPNSSAACPPPFLLLTFLLGLMALKNAIEM